MNDHDPLAENLQALRAAVTSRPSLLEGVMDRIGETPSPISRHRRKPLLVACLSAAACLLVAGVGWMLFGGGDSVEKALLDDEPQATVTHGKAEAEDLCKARFAEEGDPAGAHDRGEPTVKALQPGDRHFQGHQNTLDGSAGDNRARGGSNVGLAVAIERRPRPAEFTGTWQGEALDKPQDGSATSVLVVKLTISADDQLQGVASGTFSGGEEVPLEDVYVVGRRLEFRVRHRSGAQMQVTLSLGDDTLTGDGIPIRSAEARCDIVLKRRSPEGPV